MNTKEILDYWFQNTTNDSTNAFWFDKSHDNLITQKYKLLVDTITIDNYINYIKDKNDKIALLIAGDQFTRNIYRNVLDRTKNDNWALKLALDMINMNQDIEYQLNYRYFILLPLRHAKLSHLLDIVRSRIKLYQQQYNIPKSLIKFYNNTIQNYAELNDTIKIGEKIEYKEEFEKILEKYDKKDIKKSLDFVHNSCKKYKNIALSLSGGVDSMVLFNALNYNDIHFVAIHIEYCNREEAKLEREFLEYYCYMNNIKLYYRTINYIVRDDNRELFEIETRKARFNLYKYVVDREHLEGVMLGHHSGDIVENVFTNIIKGRSINDITAMRDTQEQNGVMLIRPFIKLKKDDIIQIAHSNMIPYFLNSTPGWSCRGVLRDNVIPILKKQFGDFENNIIKFTESCDNYTKFYNNNINDKINETVLTYGSKILFHFSIINSDTIEMILLNTMHRNGYNMVSHKLKNNFIQWLNGNKTNQIDLGKNMFCYYKNNYIYFVNYTKIIKNKPNKELLIKDFDNYLSPKIYKNI